MMFVKFFALATVFSVSFICVAAKEEPLSHVDILPAEVVVLPGDMADQLALLREATELAEMLAPVAEESGMYVAPAATVRLVVRKWLQPRCRALQQLPVGRLRELCLLADAIDWQGAWLQDMAEGDSCVAIPREAEPLTCLQRMAKVAAVLRQRLNTPGEEALRGELLYLTETLGGMQVLALPEKLLEQRMAKDYKTAYFFFCEFRAALEQGDAAAMRNLVAYTDYLLQSEADTLRLNALAGVYASVCRAEYELRPPAYTVSPAMMDAVQPFLLRLPNLRGVLP